MKSHPLIWLVFALCLILVLAAMAWLSAAVFRLDRAETDARRQTDVEEKAQLALWRMDSTLAPLISQESARPSFEYLAYYAADRTSDQKSKSRNKNETLIVSPLLTETPPQILLHFQYDDAGNITSPQLPRDDNRPAENMPPIDPLVRENRLNLLNLIRKLASAEKLIAMLPEPKAVSLRIVRTPSAAQSQIPTDKAASSPQQAPLMKNEYSQRAQVFEMQNMNAIAQNRSINQPPAIADSPQTISTTNTDFSGALMTPLWIEDRLILARRMLVGGKQFVQGCMLDWPAIRRELLDSIKDLLPHADLVPAGENHAPDVSRRLAALPVRLMPGSVAFADDKNRSPLLLSLFAAWICLAATAAAIAGLLAGVIRLSARRASFVTAVTHELRTPLTTFQMYAEMLASDMVPDEPQKKEYLNTLRAEAIRLTHLVENVLAYARLERGRFNRRLEIVSLSDLIASMQNRLVDRAVQAGMRLVVEQAADSKLSPRTLGEGPGDRTPPRSVETNVSAVEQILFNLVDNACKYASSAEDKCIYIFLSEESGKALVRVEDHGPGIAPDMRRRLFRSFSKTAREAAHSAPGIGLGLALSRRLARDLGGTLRYEEKPTPGASFVLELPLA